MHDKPKHQKVDAAMLRHCFMSQEDLPFALKIKRASQGACQGPIPHPIALWASHLGGLFWHWIVLDPNRSYSFIYKILHKPLPDKLLLHLKTVSHCVSFGRTLVVFQGVSVLWLPPFKFSKQNETRKSHALERIRWSRTRSIWKH